MTTSQLIDSVRIVPDFPLPGIQFFDVTTLFKNPEAFEEVIERICALYKDKGVTKVAGIESRGFIAGAAVASRLGAGFVPVRKPGKLPADTISASYDKEYGKDTIEIHADAITPDDVVLIHDDLLATGGTARAAVELVNKFHPKKVFVNFLIALKEFDTLKDFPEDTTTLLTL